MQSLLSCLRYDDNTFARTRNLQFFAFTLDGIRWSWLDVRLLSKSGQKTVPPTTAFHTEKKNSNFNIKRCACARRFEFLHRATTLAIIFLLFTAKIHVIGKKCRREKIQSANRQAMLQPVLRYESNELKNCNCAESVWCAIAK